MKKVLAVLVAIGLLLGNGGAALNAAAPNPYDTIPEELLPTK